MARKKPRKPATPASSKLPARKALDPDDYDPEDGELSHDEQLTLFLRRPPAGAERVCIFAFTASGEQVMQDRSAAEARSAPVQLANTVMALSERWARTEGRETRFRAQWQAGERVLASHQWRCGEGDPTALDGTVESFLSQAQRHLEHRERTNLEGYNDQKDGWRELISAYRDEVKALRADNEQLRKRLQRADDTDAELARMQAEAAIGQKERTADIIEHRLLPLMQHFALKAAADKSAAPAAVGDTPK